RRRDEALEESRGDRLFEHRTRQQGSPERIGLLANLGGERTQVLFGELTGTELQLLLLRAEMKRDGHGGSHRSRGRWCPQRENAPRLRPANRSLCRVHDQPGGLVIALSREARQ